MMGKEGNCAICKGVGKNMFNETCTYCNGTGESNSLAKEYLKNHIWQCIYWDRKFCPICKKKCHHDSTLSPKQKIEPGYGGEMGATNSYSSDSMIPSEQEGMIIA